MQLQASWRTAWLALAQNGGDMHAGDALFTAILGRYSEAHRRYHTLQHLQECLDHFETASALAQHPHEVALALWFHDAIYDTRAHNNEAVSAQWAMQALDEAGAAAEVCGRVHGLIMATQHSALPTTPDGRLLVDIDLSILGALPMRFDEYEAQIRSEYSFVDATLFRQKRAAILSAFLERDRIYATPFFYQKLEMQARENLTRSVLKLG